MSLRQTYQTRPLAAPSLYDKGVSRVAASVLPYYVESKIVIPAFDITSDWYLGSHVVLQLNYVASKPFSFTDYPLDATVFLNCCVMVAWRINDRKRRYKLLSNGNERVPGCTYDGEIVPVNFTIEIWNTPVARAQLESDYELGTTIWRDRNLAETDPTVFDELDNSWLGEYADLQNQTGLVLPYSYDYNIQHLNN